MDHAGTNFKSPIGLGNALEQRVEPGPVNSGPIDSGPLDREPLRHRAKPTSNPAHHDRATRYTLFIRAAKLVSSQGEFVCVVRDVSETGVRLRLFHAPPKGLPLELHMTNGQAYVLRQAWHKDNEAGFAFEHRIDLSKFVEESSKFPKRGIRLDLLFPVTITTLSGSSDGIVENISQQGARIACKTAFAIDQNVRIECPEEEIQLGEVSAKVRWRREDAYGVVFENTLSLEEFAKLAARLQCPQLLV